MSCEDAAIAHQDAAPRTRWLHHVRHNAAIPGRVFDALPDANLDLYISSRGVDIFGLTGADVLTLIDALDLRHDEARSSLSVRTNGLHDSLSYWTGRVDGHVITVAVRLFELRSCGDTRTRKHPEIGGVALCATP